jgi:hypothetical protein
MLGNLFKKFQFKKKKLQKTEQNIVNSDSLLPNGFINLNLVRSKEILNYLEEKDIQRLPVFQRWAKRHEKCLDFDVKTQKSDMVYRKLNTLFAKYKRISDKVVDSNSGKISQEDLEILCNDWMYEFYLAIKE